MRLRIFLFILLVEHNFDIYDLKMYAVKRLLCMSCSHNLQKKKQNKKTRNFKITGCGVGAAVPALDPPLLYDIHYCLYTYIHCDRYLHTAV